VHNVRRAVCLRIKKSAFYGVMDALVDFAGGLEVCFGLDLEFITYYYYYNHHRRYAGYLQLCP